MPPEHPRDTIATWLHNENEPRTLEQVVKATGIAGSVVQSHLDFLVGAKAVEKDGETYEWFGVC